LAIRDPVCGHRRAGRQHLLKHDVTFQAGAFVAAILLRPGHADPAALAHLAGEVGVKTAPRRCAHMRRNRLQFLGEESTHFASQLLGFRHHGRIGKGEERHHAP
jgi:hypothetical protein